MMHRINVHRFLMLLLVISLTAITGTVAVLVAREGTAAADPDTALAVVSGFLQMDPEAVAFRGFLPAASGVKAHVEVSHPDGSPAALAVTFDPSDGTVSSVLWLDRVEEGDTPLPRERALEIAGDFLIDQGHDLELFRPTRAEQMPLGPWLFSWGRFLGEAATGETLTVWVSRSGRIAFYHYARPRRAVSPEEVRISREEAIRLALAEARATLGAEVEWQVTETRLQLSSPLSPSGGPVWSVTVQGQRADTGPARRDQIFVDAITGRRVCAPDTPPSASGSAGAP